MAFRRRWIVGLTLAGVLALEAAAIVAVVRQVRTERRAAHDQQIEFDKNSAHSWVENTAKPIVRPSILEAKDAEILPDEMVVGVEVGNRARAYSLRSLTHPSGHLVNDMIGGVPVSVAYCNITGCVRIYTDSQGSAPLDTKVAGLLDGEMVVSLRGNLYFQRSDMPVEPDNHPPAMPYNVLTPTLTTWKEWASSHPKTDVYLRGRSPPRGS
jgi:hypothetical protein